MSQVLLENGPQTFRFEWETMHKTFNGTEKNKWIWKVYEMNEIGC